MIFLKKGNEPGEELKKELIQQVRKMIGPIATPDELDFVDMLPKTRSGKIMRRVLKAQELGQPLGDTSTLENWLYFYTRLSWFCKFSTKNILLNQLRGVYTDCNLNQ